MKPKIDDQFWFDMSYDMVKGSIERLRSGAQKIQNLILWAFGIYTGSAIFTVEYKNIGEIGILIILCLPYLLLILGYWQAHMAQLPTSVEFDYKSPTQIERAYIEGYSESNKRLNRSKWISFIGLLALAISLMLAFLLKNQMQEEFYLKAKINQGSHLLLVTGKFPENQELKINRISYFDNGTMSLDSDTLLNSNTGLFFKSYPIAGVSNKIKIEIGWSDKEYSQKLMKEITVFSDRQKQ
jgi:hypothetical protein